MAAHGTPRERRIAIVPGISCERAGLPDVMRGEETQVFGALALLGIDAATFVLPGTHSKWVTVEGGRIREFRTAMSGEFYDLLRKHSILSRSLGPADAEAPFDEATFDRGVHTALQGDGLLQTAFSVRTLSLFDRLAAASLPSYLSGLVIGEELRGRPLARGSKVVVIGEPSLARRFERALGQRVSAPSSSATRRHGTASSPFMREPARSLSRPDRWTLTPLSPRRSRSCR